MSWASHQAYLSDNWRPGEHVSIIDPTGGGKTYLATRGLLPLWSDYRALILDTKGDDETLIGVGHKMTTFPNRLERMGRKRPAWYRVIIKTTLSGVSRRQQQAAADSALRRAYRERGWLVMVDELKTLVRLQLTHQIEDYYERGRRSDPRKALTFIGLSQAPVWMPSCVYSQPRHLYLGPILDVKARKRVMEIGGYTDAIRRVLPTLRGHEFLYIGDGGRKMEVVQVGR